MNYLRFPSGLVGRMAALTVAVATLLLLALTPQSANAQSAKGGPVKVYMVRGFMGVFSTGLDELAATLQKKGIATEVYGHLSGGAIRAKIRKQHTGKPKLPLVLVGHSFGGNAALQVAALLEQDNIPVDLVVTIDPTKGGPLAGNVRRYVNYYISANVLGTKLAGGGVKSSRVRNIDIRDRSEIIDSGTGHWTMTSDDVIQSEILSEILRAAR